MEFLEAYGDFLRDHTKGRQGESLRRLKEGHGHAERTFLENVWWPAFGHFKFLYPEHEVNDFRDGVRYLDFAYIRPPIFACFEIDGYGPHWRHVDRWQFADHLHRQNSLVIDGWQVLRFSYDEVVSKPRRCQQMIQQFIGRWLGEGEGSGLSSRERAIIHEALRRDGRVTPGDVSQQLGVCDKTSQKLLRGLMEKGLFVSAGGTQRVRIYVLKPEKVRRYM